MNSQAIISFGLLLALGLALIGFVVVMVNFS